MAAGLWLVRDPFMMWLFGAEYTASADTLAWLAPVLPLLAISALGTFVLAASRRMTAVAAIYGGALAINVALNVLWIPLDGAIGSARAMLVSETVVSGAMLGVLMVVAGAAPRLRMVVPALAVALPSTAVALVMPPLSAGLAYAVIVTLGYVVLDVVTVEERSLVRKALSL
jgi:O-antigen/teichoic acid export membrane protein